jgi:hypothetical protein
MKNNKNAPSKNFSKKNLLFEAEIYVPGYAQNAGFCTIYPRASGGALSGPLTKPDGVGKSYKFLHK